VVTLATNTALSLPCGVNEQGMPFGVQLIAPVRSDYRLLGMAAAIEACFAMQPRLGRSYSPKRDWVSQHPLCTAL
jgi:amidase